MTSFFIENYIMKKIGSFLLSTILAVSAFGQHTVGLWFGPGISDLGGSGNYEMKLKTGVHGGLFLAVQLNHKLILQPELSYSNAGAKYQTNNGVNHSLFLNYVNMPLQVQYSFSKRFRVQTGPQLSVLIATKDKVMGTETGFFTSQDFQTVDLLWGAGINCMVHSRFGIYSHYNFSIGKMNNGGVNTFKNKVLQIGVLYVLKSSRKMKQRQSGE
jgi:hypothetical protein